VANPPATGYPLANRGEPGWIVATLLQQAANPVEPIVIKEFHRKKGLEEAEQSLNQLVTFSQGINIFLLLPVLFIE
jgi:hypothetical protein